MRRRSLVFFMIVAAFFTLGISAFAGLSVTEQSTKTKGATTVTWDSAFQDLDYAVGTPITMTVTWTADTGGAAYQGFELKRFTPGSKKDPADGLLLSINPDGTSVTVEFVFTDLHLDRRRNVEVGNAHFKLYLWIDKDGDGVGESVAGYGVNVHVEDPQ